MPKAVAKKPNKTKTTPYDVAEHLRTPEEMAAYLDAWLEEAPDDAAGIGGGTREHCPCQRNDAGCQGCRT